MCLILRRKPGADKTATLGDRRRTSTQRPAARHTTTRGAEQLVEPIPVRAAIREALLGRPLSAHDISQRASLSEKDVAAHLEHLQRSLRARGERHLPDRGRAGPRTTPGTTTPRADRRLLR
jgi:hypothetical protein